MRIPTLSSTDMQSKCVETIYTSASIIVNYNVILNTQRPLALREPKIGDCVHALVNDNRSINRLN